MVFLEFLEGVVSALIMIFFVTQIIVPLWRGVPLFPLFRLKRRILLDDLKEAREELELNEMADEAEKMRLRKEEEKQRREHEGQIVKEFES